MIDFDEEARDALEQMHEILAVHGPRGEQLAGLIGPTLDGAHAMDVIVAMSLIRCFLEDTCEGEETDIGISLDLVYAYVRSNLYSNLGEGH